MTLSLRRILGALPWLVLAGFAVHALVGLFLPYVLHHHLQTGDHPGHLFLSTFARERLLPWPYGWNERLWLGFPQDQLYPPLVHVASGLLGGLVGDALALKLLVGVALLGVLPAGYALGRAHGLSRDGAAALAALLWALGFVGSRHLGTDLAYGVNLESTFRAGMVVAAIGWPLLLLTLAALARGPRSGTAPVPLAASALLALTLLTHLVAGLAAVLYLGARLLTGVAAAQRAGQPARPIVVWYIGAGALAFLLAGVWLVPFLLGRGLISAEAIGLRWTVAEVATLALPALLAAVAGVLKRDRAATALAVLAALVALATVVVDRAELPTHAYRFLPVMWLCGAVALGLLLSRWPWAGALVAGAAALALSVGVDLAVRGNPPLELHAPVPLPESSRTLVAIRTGHAPGYQAANHAWATAVGPVSHGISVESAGNNRALFGVLQELDAGIPIWSVYPPAAPPLDGDGRRADRWLRKLRHLGLTHVLTDLRLEPLLGDAAARVSLVGFAGAWAPPGRAAALDAAAGRYHVDAGHVRYALYELPRVALVEPLRTLPHAVAPEQFEAAAAFQWLQGDPQGVVTDAPPPSEAQPGPPEASVTAIRLDPDSGTLSFHVGAPAPVPILVRVAWHPGWEATMEGAPVPLHRASPSLVLLYGRGSFTLGWRRGAAAPAGLALTVAGLALLVLLALRRRSGKERRC